MLRADKYTKMRTDRWADAGAKSSSSQKLPAAVAHAAFMIYLADCALRHLVYLRIRSDMTLTAITRRRSSTFRKRFKQGRIVNSWYAREMTTRMTPDAFRDAFDHQKKIGDSSELQKSTASLFFWKTRLFQSAWWRNRANKSYPHQMIDTKEWFYDKKIGIIGLGHVGADLGPWFKNTPVIIFWVLIDAPREKGQAQMPDFLDTVATVIAYQWHRLLKMQMSWSGNRAVAGHTTSLRASLTSKQVVQAWFSALVVRSRCNTTIPVSQVTPDSLDTSFAFLLSSYNSWWAGNSHLFDRSTGWRSLSLKSLTSRSGLGKFTILNCSSSLPTWSNNDSQWGRHIARIWTYSIPGGHSLNVIPFDRRRKRKSQPEPSKQWAKSQEKSWLIFRNFFRMVWNHWRLGCPTFFISLLTA